MHRTHPSKAYDFLHGIHFPANISSLSAYLSYFPPPPPLIPGPPPQRSWTCSAYSLSSSSCFVADDLNPPSLRTYVPLTASNQSSIKNTSPISRIADHNSKVSPLLQFLQTHLTVILLLIIFICILAFVILFFTLFLYFQRSRQRRPTTHVHLRSTNTNVESNNHHQHNTNKNKNFYYHLLPYREKTSTTVRKSANESNRSRCTNHDSSVVEVRRSIKSSGTHQNTHEEQEEAL